MIPSMTNMKTSLFYQGIHQFIIGLISNISFEVTAQDKSGNLVGRYNIVSFLELTYRCDSEGWFIEITCGNDKKRKAKVEMSEGKAQIPPEKIKVIRNESGTAMF